MPLLFVHAPLDEVVGFDKATRLFYTALHTKSFISLNDADHLLTRQADAAQVAEVIAGWADRYLPDAPTADLPPTGTVEAAIAGRAFATTLRAGRHGWLVDEPRSVGGRGCRADALRPAAGGARRLHCHDAAHGGGTRGHSA